MKQKIEIEVDVPDGKKAVWKDGKVVFEDVLSELPKTWKEFCYRHPVTSNEYYIGKFCDIERCNANDRDYQFDGNVLPSEETAKQHLALMQLHQLRDCYRQGWVPDWRDSLQDKYCIWHFNGGYDVDYSETAPFFLAFQSKEIAEEFLHNFHNLIEQAGDLI